MLRTPKVIEHLVEAPGSEPVAWVIPRGGLSIGVMENEQENKMEESHS